MMGTPYIVTNDSTAPDGTTIAWCEPGDYVLGGGFERFAFGPGGAGGFIVNKPIEGEGRQGWLIGYGWPATAYAICASIQVPN